MVSIKYSVITGELSAKNTLFGCFVCACMCVCRFGVLSLRVCEKAVTAFTERRQACSKVLVINFNYQADSRSSDSRWRGLEAWRFTPVTGSDSSTSSLNTSGSFSPPWQPAGSLGRSWRRRVWNVRRRRYTPARTPLWCEDVINPWQLLRKRQTVGS